MRISDWSSDVCSSDLLAQVARAAAEALVPFARERAIDFAIEIDPSAGEIEGDARRLQQGIEHMLRHAIAGTPERGRVLLHTDGNDHAARIVVSDNGPGMSRAAISHAFDRPAADSRAPADRGLGLGLPLARQIVEAQDRQSVV